MKSSSFMTGSKKHAEARKLHSYNLPHKQVGEIIANMEGRNKPYNKTTVSSWLKYGSWSEYVKGSRDALQRFREKRDRPLGDWKLNLDKKQAVADKDWNTGISTPSITLKELKIAKHRANSSEDRVIEYATRAFVLYKDVYKRENVDPASENLITMILARMIQAEEINNNN